MHHFYRYRAHIQEIPRIRDDLEFLKSEWSIPQSETRQILVIVEEIFSNIVRYAFNDKKEHHVDIRLGIIDNQIEIEFIDDGIDFNPLEYQISPLPDPTTSDAGGMGLTLIRTFSNQIEYNRLSGKNHLKITKKVKSK
jgi:anti-sigma regulatory factor (Ser/Thr protein kinase)